MKNFIDIHDNVSPPKYICGDTHNYVLETSDLEYNLNNILVSQNIIVGGGLGYFVIDNRTLFFGGEPTELMSNPNVSVDSEHLYGNFYSINIRDNSLPISSIEPAESGLLFSTNGTISLGDNLELDSNGILKPTGDGVNLNSGLKTKKNSTEIVSDGIYIFDDLAIPNTPISYNGVLNRVYLINNSGFTIMVGSQIILYNGEICIVSGKKKLKSNY